MSTKFNVKTFQGMILALQEYWANQGCTVVQPFDMEVGAGTSHPMTALRALGPEPMAFAYVQPSRRPTDGRYGENPKLGFPSYLPRNGCRFVLDRNRAFQVNLNRVLECYLETV